MSIVIKGMKPPKACVDCPLFLENEKNGELWCGALDCAIDYMYWREKYQYHNADCPLLELPDNHGDLIDRDVLRTDGFREIMCRNGVDEGGVLYVPLRDVMKAISNASVVIPAERSEE